MTTNGVRNRWQMVLAICLGFFMIMLDTTIVYVATPSILSGLRATLDQVLWVFNGYLLAYAVLLITAGSWATSGGLAASSSPAWWSSPPPRRSAGSLRTPTS